MRQFIRHPVDIPITYRVTHTGSNWKNHIRNISQGGLRFRADTSLEQGCIVHIGIPIRELEFTAVGIIVWCRKINEHFDVGVRFTDENTEFAVRMIEQICHICHYQRQVLEQEGRQLSREEAAVEWMDKFAQDFPR